MAQLNLTEQEITSCLMMIVAWAGNVAAAHRALEAEGKRTPAASTLNAWIKGTHHDRYEELREKYADQMEKELVNEYRDVARLAMEVERRGLEKAMAALDAERDRDPSRTAANAATVADKSTRNMQLLQGRPTSVREDRKLDEILRSLVARGVIDIPDVPDEPEKLEKSERPVLEAATA